MNNRLLQFEQIYLRIHMVVVSLFFVYAVLAYVLETVRNIPWSIVLMILTTHGIGHLLYALKFFKKKKFYVVYKIVSLLILALLVYHNHLVIHMVALVLYGLNALELSIQSQTETVAERQTVLLMVAGPLVVGYAAVINFYGISSESLFMLILVLLANVSVTLFVTSNDWNRLEIIREKENLLKSYLFEKESLKLERHKHKQLVSKLTDQKIEIEEKNSVLKRVSAEMYTQTELLRYISSVLDIRELISLVTDSIMGATGVDTSMLVIYDRETGEKYYQVRSITGGNTNQVLENDFKNSIALGYYDPYFEGAKPFLDSHVVASKYPFLGTRTVGSLIIVPLTSNMVTYGLIISEHHSPGVLDQNSVNFLKSITNQINIAINNANMYKKMESLAIRDGLTQLYNRRHVQEHIVEAIDHELVDTLTLAIFDVDHFKKFNDTYGHLFGDETLKAIAGLAQEFEMIYGCMAARYGGEEFLMVFENKSLDEVKTIMDLFHDRIKNLSLVHKKVTQVQVNISMGISSYPSMAMDPETLLQRADNVMYYAKKNGRGQVVVDRPDFEKVI